MIVLVVIDVLVLLDGMLAQTCGPTFRPDCNYQDQRLDSYQISHLMNFTLQRCAMECLLVKKCASFNHRNTSGICELNNVSLTDVGVDSLEPLTGFQHYDIRDWDPVIAGTCASRPCAVNERCFQTTPFACVVVDCGRPPSYSKIMPSSRVRLTSAPTVTTIGSTAVYDCNDPLFLVSFHPTDMAPFLNRATKICNSDFSWSINQPYCLSNPAHDCKDIMERGGNPTSGIFTITLPQSGVVIPVYCDMATDGGGWTVFQYRFNGITEFYRNMSDYIHGFGELKAEFWLGLKYIQELSTYCPEVDLRLDLVKADGTSGYETFSNFSLSSAPGYTLNINRGTGTLGDNEGLSYSNGYNFATFDNDTSYGCAVRRHGGWWYGTCAWANLNGEYLHPPGGVSSYDGGAGGMVYYDFDGWKSLKSSKMMMRRKTSRKC